MYFSLKMWMQQKWMRSIGKWNISNGKLITINVQIRGGFFLYIWAQLLYLHDLFPSLVCLLFPVGFAWILQSKLARRSQWIGPTLASKRFLPMQLNNLNECQKKKLPTTNSFGRALFGPRPSLIPSFLLFHTKPRDPGSKSYSPFRRLKRVANKARDHTQSQLYPLLLFAMFTK